MYSLLSIVWQHLNKFGEVPSLVLLYRCNRSKTKDMDEYWLLLHLDNTEVYKKMMQEILKISLLQEKYIKHWG